MDVKKATAEFREMFVWYLIIPFVLIVWAWGLDGVMWLFIITFLLQLIFGEIHAVVYVALAGFAIKTLTIALGVPFANFLWGYFYPIIYWWIYYLKYKNSYKTPLS